MARFRKKPVVVEAIQWFKLGDHIAVTKFVKGFPGVPDCNYCGLCKKHRDFHGLIQTLETPNGFVVCPGDWIITGVKGEHYACKPDIFEATYEIEP